MKKDYLFCCTLLLGVISFTACNDKNDEFDDKGNSSVLSFDGPATAFMGDSIAFSFDIAASGVKPNQTKLQLWFEETMVSERVMLTPENGKYSGKILIPYMKDREDDTVNLKLRVQNERFANAMVEKTIDIIRPKFNKLILKDKNGVGYDMLPTETPYEYAVTGEFPSELFATIESPKYGENGNEMEFGLSNGKIINGASDKIEFTSDIEGKYTVTFNTKSYEGTPFVKFAINNIEFDNNNSAVIALAQGQDVSITGLKSDYANYWVNAAFFRRVKGTDGKTLRFMGRDGKYKVSVDKELKYFRVEVMNDAGSAIADLNKGDDVIWCIGDNNIGQPSYSKNGINWSAGDKVICLAPIGNKRHQMVLEAGKSIKTDNVNFKFFLQKGWGGEFTKNKYSEMDIEPYFSIPADDGNVRGGSSALIASKFYIITVDISEGNSKAKIYTEQVDGFDEVDPLPTE